jgi:hypothetical protein
VRDDSLQFLGSQQLERGPRDQHDDPGVHGRPCCRHIDYPDVVNPVARMCLQDATDAE